MTRRSSIGLSLAIASTAFAAPAWAQYGGGMGAPGGMQPPPPMGQEPKEEGPAEEAPEEEGRPSDLEPLAEYAEQGRRKMQIFEVNGYLRLRADYMHDFFMGQGYTTLNWMDPNGNSHSGLPPFPLPLSCPSPADTGSAVTTNVNCPNKNTGNANLRLRLEPTLNVTDQVRVHAQIDVLDNTILGSTPDSLAGIPGYNRVPPTANVVNGMVSPTSLPGVAPASYLYTTQNPPEVGQNGLVSSIRAKQAWAEIDSEFGSLRFGRMPWQWGRGIFYNNGSCPDCDVGTTVDRVMALTQLYGHQIAAAWDLGAQGYTAPMTSLGQNSPEGYPYDLGQDDDVLELMASITKIDPPVHLRERVDRGDVVVNYGVQFVYRLLGQESNPQLNSQGYMGTQPNPYGPQPLIPSSGIMVGHPVGATTYTPDLWLKLYYKALTVEAEWIGIFGKVEHPFPLTVDTTSSMSIIQMGWVAAGELRLYRDTLFVGMETGGATGDSAEDPSQYLNYRWHFVQQPAGDHSLDNFHFSPDYHIDEILFRHIIGTVTNAIYFKPQVAYWFDLGQTRAVGLTGSFIYSLAQVPVSTPGNALSYGIEMNLGATYRNSGEGVYGGVVWGVLWPLAALDRPAVLWQQQAADANAAQILRVFMGVRF
jgi:uncharacterized protein (TIGR04551 family)